MLSWHHRRIEISSAGSSRVLHYAARIRKCLSPVGRCRGLLGQECSPRIVVIDPGHRCLARPNACLSTFSCASISSSWQTGCCLFIDPHVQWRLAPRFVTPGSARTSGRNRRRECCAHDRCHRSHRLSAPIRWVEVSAASKRFLLRLSSGGQLQWARNRAG